jgi:hypothetical protein
VRCHLHTLHGVVASSFGEVKARCLPFPVQNAKVEELIDWVGEEVKAVPDTVWQLNDNFIVLPIEGVLNLLYGTGYQDLSGLRELAMSNDVSVVENVPGDV